MIPLSIPNISGNEWKYVKDCLDTGWISSAGEYVNEFEQQLADFTGAKYAVACMNGTVGLQIALQVAGVEPEDYVLAPNLTFVATLNSIKHARCEPILFDVDKDTWQIDLDLVEQFLEQETELQGEQLVHKRDKKRISAIMPVHMLGNMPDMMRLTDVANKYGLTIVEDAAESLGSSHQERHSGTFGVAGVISFNGNKIVSTGGGGMILTNSKEFAERAKHLTTTAKTDPDEYIHDEVGYNYRMVNVLAAIGVAQMERLPVILERNQNRDSFYRDQLQDSGKVGFQKIGAGVKPNNWLTTVLVDKKDEVVNALKEKGIQSRPIWCPMNKLKMYSKLEYVTKQNISDKLHRSAISLPSSSVISDKQLEEVVSVVRLALLEK